MTNEYIGKILEYLASTKPIVASVADIATILGIAVALYGYNQWRKIHVNERESNSYLELKKKILALKFLIDELRSARFFLSNPRQVKLMRPYFESSTLPLIKNIQKSSVEILQELYLLEGVSSIESLPKQENKGEIFQQFKKNIHDRIIVSFGRHAAYYMYEDEGERFENSISVLFPSEKGNIDPNEIIQNAIGQEIFMDQFGKEMDDSFNQVLQLIEKKIL